MRERTRSTHGRDGTRDDGRMDNRGRTSGALTLSSRPLDSGAVTDAEHPSADPATPPRRIVLVAGPSGSGKGVMTRRSGLPLVPLDEFYRDHDDPGLPRRFGIVDWDDPASWNVRAALDMLTQLAHEGSAEMPVYSIPTSRRTGTRTFTAEQAPLVVAEGIFAAELVGPLRDRGLLADALVLDRPVPLVFGLRLARDVREGRKPVPKLLRRGWGLARDQREDLNGWAAAGMRRVGLHEGVRRLQQLTAIADAEQRQGGAGIGGTPGSTATPTDPVATASPPAEPAAAPSPAADPTATPSAPGRRVLRIAAVCFLREGEAGWELLTVRKRGTSSFMQVGGKLEPGESAREAATREVAEEIGIVIEPERFDVLGDFRAAAANEADTDVDATVLLAPPDSLPRDVEVQAELEEARWLSLAEIDGDPSCAPLMRQYIAPLLRSLLP